MDKYTVDLDKVLNDFEYSEYSLENAKFNKNVQEDISSTSYNSNYSNKNDTTGKHSINNVFHSLNEYLSSDIKLREVEISEEDVPKHITKFVDNSRLFFPQVKIVPNETVEEHTDVNVNLDLDNKTQSFSNDEIPNCSHSIINNEDLTEKTDKLLDSESDRILPDNTIDEHTDNMNEYTISISNDIPQSNNQILEENLLDLDITSDVNDHNNQQIEENKELDTNIPSEEVFFTPEISVTKFDEIIDDNEKILIKVGFEKDVQLDEDNLDEYFKEIEQEFGDIDGTSIKVLENESEDVVETEQIENVEAEEPTQINQTDEKEDVEKITESVNETTEPIDNSNELTTETINDNEITESSTTQDKIEIEENLTDTDNIENELEKNSRPQNLTINEDTTQDMSRKINLIGEPGSTPYNNVYITKDLEKSDIVEGCNNENSNRPQSPTYSDVSTDSVSSNPSEEAENKDTTADIHSEEKKIEIQKENEETSEGVIQNNLISQGETCKNDVTTDKDFKNNLKTNYSEESSENIKSNVEINEPNENPDESCNKNANVQELSEQSCSNESKETVIVTKNEETTTIFRTEETSTSLGMDWLGKQAPLWIPDSEAMSCLHCDLKFTLIKRRHHCRACGLVLCSKCCDLKYRLEYLDADARVCRKCFDILNRDTNSSSGSEISQESSSPVRNLGTTQDVSNLGQPNPNNPLEYCSTVPPQLQVDVGAMATPSVLVPVGVLKRKGSNKGKSNKSVMFCDGIRPGSDLTNLDTDFNYSANQKAEKLKKSPEKSKINKHQDLYSIETKSFIPVGDKFLPPTVAIFKTDIKYSSCANNSSVVEMLRNETLIFALHSNVFVHVKIINMDCCINRVAWCFSTEGLINVGQDEIVILLEVIENESLVPKDIFIHLNDIYLEALNGTSVKELGLSEHTSSIFLGSKNHGGFVYTKPSFQCMQNVIIPKEPYLIGILIHRWEIQWAKLFPLRLVLRLGAKYKYYPSPIISTRERESTFGEVGHTIINLLADFRNFSFTLPQIRGLTIHMEDKNTTVTIPINRYDQVLKVLSNSSEHILAFSGNFSTTTDSHLVCIQDLQGGTNSYSTHAINICNQPRKVTGASFIVFNGALKSSSGLTAKSNIVEDGLMIQILPEHMLQVRESLKNMKHHTIKCGCVNEESDETVTITWGQPDTGFNVGIFSPIDNKSMGGIPSIRVHNGKDYPCNSGTRLIRWTEVFIIENGDESVKNQDPIDISKISENIAKATCEALVKYLDLLVSNSFYKIGLRANLHVENVSYAAGSNNVKLPPIYMKSLDNELIPVLHRITSNNVTEQPIILELIFRILNV